MKIVSAAEMAAIDSQSNTMFSLPACVLMQNAGRAVAQIIKRDYSGKRILVLCGPGNNGGDGYVVAATLQSWGQKTDALAFQDTEKLSGEPGRYANFFRKCGGVILTWQDAAKFSELLFHYDVVVDALFGTGLARPLRGSFAEAVRELRASKIPCVAVDIPSGVSADTGQILNEGSPSEAVKAELTITVGLPKPGLYLYPGAGLVGRLEIVEIGFPVPLLEREAIPGNLANEMTVRQWLPKRHPDAYKGDFGCVLTIGGGQQYFGAPILAARAALRAGAGFSMLAAPQIVTDRVDSRDLELLLLPQNCPYGYLAKSNVPDLLALIAQNPQEQEANHPHHRVSAVCLGPGSGRSGFTTQFMADIIGKARCPMVIDADGLWHLFKLYQEKSTMPCQEGPMAITPHLGEAARLLERDAAEIKRDLVSAARELAVKYHTVAVLKGAPTIVADEHHYWINTTGGPVLSQSGTGDVLAGLIAGLAAQGMPLYQAAVSGVYLHGLAGDICTKKFADRGITAGEIEHMIPLAIQQVIGT